MESWQLTVSCLLCVALLDAVYSLDRCNIDPTNKCRCTAPTNQTLDISKYFKYPVEVISDDPSKYSYKFSPCTPMVCEDTVDVGTMCQLIKSQNRWTVLGRQTSSMSWFINDYDPLSFTVNYFDGDPDPNGVARQSKVRFVYNAETPTIGFSEELPNVVYHCSLGGVNFSEKNGCKKGPNVTNFIPMYTGRTSVKIVVTNYRVKYEFMATGKVVKFVSQSSGGGGGGGTEAGVIGWVIIALAIIGVITYFVVGGIYMYQAKEARGMDVIPNLAFWKDLPFLIKDGFVFTFGPCVNMIRGRLGYEKI